MSEAMVHVEGGVPGEAERAPGGRARTCVGCGEHVSGDALESGDLVRFVLGPDGEIAVDQPAARPRRAGRGAHVHARPVCLERAARGGLARSTKGRAQAVLTADGTRRPLGAAGLARAIGEAMDRRIEGLFLAAVRSRHVARGAEAVQGACQRGDAELVVVARDAAEGAGDLPELPGLPDLPRAVAEGRAVAWGDKRRLGRMVTLGKPHAQERADGDDETGVAVAALSSRPLAAALRQAVWMADACADQTTEVVGPARAARPSRSKRGGGRPDRGHGMLVTMGEAPQTPAQPGSTPRASGRGRPPRGSRTPG